MAKRSPVAAALLAIALTACTSEAHAAPRMLRSTGGAAAPGGAQLDDASIAATGGTQAQPPGQVPVKGTGGVSPADHNAKQRRRRTPRRWRKSLPKKAGATLAPRPNHASPAPKTTPAPPPPSTDEGASAPLTPSQTLAEGAVFPVTGAHSFGDAASRFGAPREGHVHQGQDVLAPEGSLVAAPLPGVVIAVSYQAGGAGWYAVERAKDGFSLMFAHCKARSLKVLVGDALASGAQICLVGRTGDATGPHLHFEMWVGGWHAPHSHPIDPLPYLKAWEAGR